MTWIKYFAKQTEYSTDQGKKKKNPERCMNIKTSSEVFSATNNTAIITLVISLCYSQYPVKLCVFEICAKIVNSLGFFKNKNRFLRIKVSKFDD